MGLPEALRVKAMQLFEHYLDQLSEEDVRELTTGDQLLSRVQVDRRLVQATSKGIEETYAFLAGKGVKDIRSLLSPIVPPSGSKAPALIDYVLKASFGRTYTPPAAPRSTSKRSPSTKKLPWDATEAVKHLANSTSVPASKEYLKERATLQQLKELAAMLQVPTRALGNVKDKWINAIVFKEVQARGAYDRTQTN